MRAGWQCGSAARLVARVVWLGGLGARVMLNGRMFPAPCSVASELLGAVAMGARGGSAARLVACVVWVEG